MPGDAVEAGDVVEEGDVAVCDGVVCDGVSVEDSEGDSDGEGVG